MGIVRQFLAQRDIIIYFFYGLSYFSMGTALVIMIKRPSKLPIARAIPLLAAFGVTHGMYEWSELITLFPPYRSLSSDNLPFVILHIALNSLSFYFLLRFGFELFCRLSERAWLSCRYAPTGLYAVWLLIVLGVARGGNIAEIHSMGASLSRFILCVPGALISGLALFMHYRVLSKGGFKKVAAYLLPASFFVWAYALFGMFGPKAPYWPANIINKESFVNVVGLPVSLFRMSIALGVTTFVLLSMRVFDEEESQRIKKHEGEFELLDRLIERIGQTTPGPEMISNVLENILELTQIETGAVFIKRSDSHWLHIEAARGLTEEGVRFDGTLHNTSVREVTDLAKLGQPLFGTLRDYSAFASFFVEPDDYGEFAFIPFADKEKSLGAVLVVTKTGEEIGQDERHLLRTVGSQMRIALENALLREQRRTAQILQESLLSATPEIDGLEIGVFYRSSSSTAETVVGGDFYDFVKLSDGMISIIMGDVSGRGLEAAKLTSVTKHTLRAFLHEDPSPAKALTRANVILARDTEPEQFITASIVVLKPDLSFRYSSAGHPPPLLCDEEPRFFCDVQGVPLGAFENSAYAETTGVLKKDDYLIMYTDGLTDARKKPMFFGEEGLAEAAKKCIGKTAPTLAASVVEAAVAFADGNLNDDLALVVIRPKADVLAGPLLIP